MLDAVAREKRARPNAGRRRNYRIVIWKRQGRSCADCGCGVQLHHDPAYPTPLMALQRVRADGLFSLGNLVGLCPTCVRTRGNDHGEERR